MAGASGAIYREKGKTREVAYEQLFDHNKTIQVPGLGKLAYYPNRDSLGYMESYRLENIATFMRATLRFPDFCEGWNALIKLGLTGENGKIQTDNLTCFDWATRHIEGADKQAGHEEVMAKFLSVSSKSKVIRQLKFLGLLNGDLINLGEKTDAEVLQHIVEDKLKMEASDKDMIVMMHEIEFERRNMATRMHITLVVKGTDNRHTAMAKTVGLPLGIAAKLILEEKIKEKGLHIPVKPTIYEPVLEELEKHGIVFHE